MKDMAMQLLMLSLITGFIIGIGFNVKRISDNTDIIVANIQVNR